MNEMPEEDEAAEYAALLTIFKNFLESINNSYEPWEVLEELMALRADFAIHHAIKGFGLDWEDALDLLRKDAELLGEYERDQVMVIKAAIDNLVDFSVAEEYQLAEDVAETCEDEELEDEELEELLLALNNRYNNVYAGVENKDIFYAMAVAASWIKMDNDVQLMYMTQGDERVRPWHLQFEGYTAPKRSFPEWLIPPIEHQCRCYLVYSEIVRDKIDAQNTLYRIPEIPEWFNQTFRESVAKGGRIFSDAHPYFQVDADNLDRLREIASNIKNKYFGK